MRSPAIVWEGKEGAMLSRPSRDRSRCIDMLAAKACFPCRDCILLPRGTHAFADGRAPAITLFSEGRESMAHPGDRPANNREGSFLSSALGWGVEEGAMLSRPSGDRSRCFDMLAAKACSPCRDCIQFLRATHAFAASRAQATSLFSEGRESMAPSWRTDAAGRFHTHWEDP